MHLGRVTLIVVFTLTLTLALAWSGAAVGLGETVQPKVAPPSNVIIPIRSIDPDDTDFSDLMPLKQRIGNARIVQLGEASHGDGATFLAKCRLVEFLHREMGFEVLVWESGLISCDLLNRQVVQNQPVAKLVETALARPWAKSGQARRVIEYVRSTRETSPPLELAGFDCQEGDPAALQAFGVDVVSRFSGQPNGTAIQPGLDLFADMKKTLMAYMLKPGEEKLKDLASLKQLTDHLSKTSTTKPALKTGFDEAMLRQGVRSLYGFFGLMNELAEIGFNITKVSQNNGRDAAMADNLIWLANERYKGRKLIVWAASFHLVRNPTEIDTSPSGMNYDGVVTMGHRVHKALGDSVYTIATISHHGKTGVAGGSNVRDIEPAEQGSVEAQCAAGRMPYMFIDLAAARRDPTHNFNKKLIARPLGHVPLRAVWGNHFDAFLYINEMFPSTPEGGFPRKRGR